MTVVIDRKLPLQFYVHYRTHRIANKPFYGTDSRPPQFGGLFICFQAPNGAFRQKEQPQLGESWGRQAGSGKPGGHDAPIYRMALKLSRKTTGFWYGFGRQLIAGVLRYPDLARRHQAIFGLGRCPR
jgi:hypothetical protein